MHLLQIFSPRLVFSFSWKKFLILMKSSLSILSFMDHDFGVVSEKSLPYPRSSRFSPMLSFKSFIVLCVLHLCLDPFWVSFCEGCKVCVESHIFACGCSVVLVPFVEKAVFVSLCCPCSLVKDQLTIFMWVYFWALYSVPLIYLFILLITPHCLDYYSL